LLIASAVAATEMGSRACDVSADNRPDKARREVCKACEVSSSTMIDDEEGSMGKIDVDSIGRDAKVSGGASTGA
jgi:hypothetical protein